jgi:hypothetical protein
MSNPYEGWTCCLTLLILVAVDRERSDVLIFEAVEMLKTA